MDAISIRNPWALWIAWGWKPVETRSGKRMRLYVGKRIAIHAGKLMDPRALSLADPYLTEYQRDKTLQELGKAYAENRRKITDPRFGAVICTAYAEKHRKLTVKDELYALFDCAGLWGLFLSDIQVLSRPLPWRGQQSSFTVPDELIEEACEEGGWDNVCSPGD